MTGKQWKYCGNIFSYRVAIRLPGPYTDSRDVNHTAMETSICDHRVSLNQTDEDAVRIGDELKASNLDN